ncbi:MAG: carboxypeptidase-like regulatory domain-containing protein [Acidobacteriia bacterium]|nr:carboxypeptidase-like regulatory domain-containing protein [Terriglobia bacterium]
MNRLSLFAGLLLSSSIGFGQTALATITGTISDATGAVVANAPISVKNLDNGQVYSAVSTETGNFAVSQLFTVINGTPNNTLQTRRLAYTAPKKIES